MTVMEMAKEISKTSGLPLYIHLGQLWPMPEGSEDLVDPDTIIPQVVDLMTEATLAHPFTRHPGGFVDTQGNLHPMVRVALDKGIKVMSVMGRISVSTWRVRFWMLVLFPIRLGRTCMATTRRFQIQTTSRRRPPLHRRGEIQHDLRYD